eukprot:NODE_2171_length_982_cov_235.775620.p3 GENE.NODE_2171_length_982_cov_235.775620~~NODE_2171_length_982_cov_235.775620.p3  ORF type:complete len:188 (+),score=57.44 NODE_2171_length_982_cov_235.775620:30-566(+)
MFFKRVFFFFFFFFFFWSECWRTGAGVQCLPTACPRHVGAARRPEVAARLWPHCVSAMGIRYSVPSTMPPLISRIFTSESMEERQCGQCAPPEARFCAIREEQTSQTLPCAQGKSTIFPGLSRQTTQIGSCSAQSSSSWCPRTVGWSDCASAEASSEPSSKSLLSISWKTLSPSRLNL